MKLRKQMIERCGISYASPSIEILSVVAEKCFATSCDLNFDIEETGYNEELLDW